MNTSIRESYMDQKLTHFITTELHIGKWKIAPIDLLLLIFAPVFSIMIRLSVASYTASELAAYLNLVSWLKIVTGVFDFLLAVLVGEYVYRQTGHKIKAYLAYAILLMLPVICAGSGMWGMGDSIYVFFAVLSLFLLEEGKGNASLFVYGISLFLNRYAFFLLPIFAIAFMQKKNKIWGFLFPFFGAWFRNGFVSAEGELGFPIFEADRLFMRTRGETLLSYHWPNVFQIIGPDKFVIEYGMVSRCMAVALMLVIVVSYLAAGESASKRNADGAKRTNEKSSALCWGAALGRDNLIAVSAFLCMLFPYIMPQMDERCGLLADVLLLVLVMKYTDLYYLAILQGTISFMAYSFYFRGDSVIPFSYVALAELALLFLVGQFAASGTYIRLKAFKK